MLSVDTEVHLKLTVATDGFAVNDLAEMTFEVGNQLCQQVFEQLVMRAQSQHLEKVVKGLEELVCTRCGVVHSEPGSVLRRGSRQRQLQTSRGVVRFRLLQVTCSDCRATWSPYGQMLGLTDRQRVSEELLHRLCDWVTELSYDKTTRVAAQWLGASVSARRLHKEVQERGAALEFTEGPDFQVLIADATRVPAGELERGEEACIAFQLQERSNRDGRPFTSKRVVGLGIGLGCWEEALATATAPNLVVTDGEQGVHGVVAELYPGVRHQQCEWHVPHSLKHMLGLEGVGVAERSRLAKELGGLLKQGGKSARRRYQRFADRLRAYPRAHTLLRNAADYLFHPDASVVRTTSLAERQMREVNRRTDVGVRWSVPGITNLLRLRLAQRHNEDDYQRVWTKPRPVAFNVVPQL